MPRNLGDWHRNKESILMTTAPTKLQVLHYIDPAQQSRFCKRCNADVLDDKANGAYTKSIRSYEHPPQGYVPCSKAWVE